MSETTPIQALRQELAMVERDLDSFRSLNESQSDMLKKAWAEINDLKEKLHASRAFSVEMMRICIEMHEEKS